MLGINRVRFTLTNWIYAFSKRIGLNRRNIRALLSRIPLSGIKSDSAILASAESILLRAIALGKDGKFTIVPEHISVSATENCNLKCVMCPGHAGMLGPKLSIDEAEKLWNSLATVDGSFGRPKTLDMTAGEPTLNPDLGPIHSSFKAHFPDAKISIISNATIPIRGRTRKAFEEADMISISMDGATAETYERIRKGSSYKNVVRNVKDIAEIKTEGVNCDVLRVMFVAMDQNIHELPEMVRLVHSLRIPRLFVQAAEVRRNHSPFNNDGQNVTLSISNEELDPFISAARAEAERLGIQIEFTSLLNRAHDESHQDKGLESNQQSGQTGFEIAIKTCSIPWTFAPRISQNTNGIYPTTVCCHMPHPFRSGNLANRRELHDKSIIEIFNSDFYWDIRSGLLNGALAKDACEGCQYYQSTHWTSSQLRELDKAISSIERAQKHGDTS